MKTDRKIGIRFLLILAAFSAICFAWWQDHQLLIERIHEEQNRTQQVIRENGTLRNAVRRSRAVSDGLFAQTVAQQDRINQLSQIASARNVSAELDGN